MPSAVQPAERPPRRHGRRERRNTEPAGAARDLNLAQPGDVHGGETEHLPARRDQVPSCQRHHAARRTRPGTSSWSSSRPARSSPRPRRGPPPGRPGCGLPQAGLVGAKIELVRGMTIADVTEVVGRIEASVRRAVPAAAVLYLEPDVFRTRVDATSPEPVAAGIWRRAHKPPAPTTTPRHRWLRRRPPCRRRQTRQSSPTLRTWRRSRPRLPMPPNAHSTRRSGARGGRSTPPPCRALQARTDQ
jgi:hypothetical protein